MAETKKDKDEAATEATTAKKSTRSTASKAKAETSAKADKPATRATKAAASSATADEKPAAAKASKPAAKASSTRAKASGPAVTEGAGGTLKMHHLRPAPGAHTAKTRVGRGEASKGKTAGRGTKGTKARYQVPERFEGGQMPMHMRLPKLRGFKNPFRTEYQVVNLDTLASLYPQGGDVTVDDLVAKGAVRKGHPVKVLGNGDVGVKLTVQVHAVSKSAKDKILAAGGSVAQD